MLSSVIFGGKFVLNDTDVSENMVVFVNMKVVFGCVVLSSDSVVVSVTLREVFGSVIMEYQLDVPLGCTIVEEFVVVISVVVTVTPSVGFDSVRL